MKFSSSKDFLASPHHTITLFGMSGVGKTFLSILLKGAGWFHYGVDYRIASHYMRDAMNDWIRSHAFENPLLKELWEREGMTLSAAFSPSNIFTLSKYLGKPGKRSLGGLSMQEYQGRQAQHLLAERAAMADFISFAARARTVYGHTHCLCDSSGSLCESVDLDSPHDALLERLCAHSILVYIKGDAHHREKLIERFKKSPKPIYYQPWFLQQEWSAYQTLHGIHSDDEVDPNAFSIWAFERLIAHRLPLYETIAHRYGYTLAMDKVMAVQSEADFLTLLGQSIDHAHQNS